MAKRPLKKPARVTAPSQLPLESLGRIRSAVGHGRSSIANYLSRRPHRSFRRTRRRDYQRSLAIPGYWGFTAYVFTLLKKNKTIFLGLVLFYALLGAIFVGLSSQDTYNQLSDLLDESGDSVFGSGWGSLGQAGLLILTSLSGSISPQLSEVQQVYAALILLLTWLTTVWLLRVILAGNKPKLRDGLYNAGAPIVATGIVLLVLLVQLLPATIGIIVLSSAIATDVFSTGFIAMVVTVVVFLLVILSLYWAVSTVIALIISTLPGMYPWQALRTAGDVVVGRRLRLLLRFLWLGVGNILAFLVIIVPIVVIERWLRAVVPFIQNIPVVPIAILLTSSIVVVWSAAYIYLLYRKVVEDDASPA